MHPLSNPVIALPVVLLILSILGTTVYYGRAHARTAPQTKTVVPSKQPAAQVPNKNKIGTRTNPAQSPTAQPPQQDTTVKFEVDNLKPQVGEVVVFTVTIPPAFANCYPQFTLLFGDGNSNQGGGSVSHQYKEARGYAARLVESPAAGRFCEVLKVQPPVLRLQVQPLPTPSPTATPKPTPTPKPNVTPTPKPTATSTPTPTPVPSPSPSPTPTPSVNLTPSPSPTPSASPTVSSGPTIETGTTPTPGITPSPMPTVLQDKTGGGIVDWLNLRKNWWIFLSLLLVAFGAYRAIKAGFYTRASFKPNVDLGGAEVDEGVQPLAIESQVILRPDVANAEYILDPDDVSLISSIRRRNA